MQPPPPETLPGTRRLLLVTVLALLAIGLVAVAVVWPAERGRDPTGFGRLTGLEMMGRIKLELAMDAADHAQADTVGRAEDSVSLRDAHRAVAPILSDEIRIGVASRDSSEMYLIMRRGTTVHFEWVATGGTLNVVTFGDSLNGRRTRRHRYGAEKARAASSGDLVAAFDGFHGWRWYNPGDSVVTIVIRTTGAYIGGRQASSAQ